MIAEWDDFYPAVDCFARSKYTLPWCLSYKFDALLNGFWIKFDPEFKNTVSDPRDNKGKLQPSYTAL